MKIIAFFAGLGLALALFIIGVTVWSVAGPSWAAAAVACATAVFLPTVMGVVSYWARRSSRELVADDPESII